jgi:hypothetical protein
MTLGGWFLLYELMLLNVEDRDTRDMMWDMRTTLPAIQAHHAHFRTASWRYLEPLAVDEFDVKVLVASHDLPVVRLSLNLNPRLARSGAYVQV